MFYKFVFLFFSSSYALSARERFSVLPCGKQGIEVVDEKNVTELEVHCPLLPFEDFYHIHWVVEASFADPQKYDNHLVEVFLSHAKDVGAFKLPFTSYKNETLLFHKKTFLCQDEVGKDNSSLRILLNTRSPIPIELKLEVEPLWYHGWRQDLNMVYHSEMLNAGLEELAMIEFRREHLDNFKDDYALVTVDQVRGNMCFVAIIQPAGCFNHDVPHSNM